MSRLRVNSQIIIYFKIFIFIVTLWSCQYAVDGCRLQDVEVKLSKDNYVTVEWKLTSTSDECAKLLIGINIALIGCELDDPDECEQFAPAIRASVSKHSFPLPLELCYKYELHIIETFTGKYLHERKFDTIVLSKIKIDHINQIDDLVELHWSFDGDFSCINAFEVKVLTPNNANEVKKTINIEGANEATVDGLERCEEYTFSVHPKDPSLQDYSDSQNFQLQPPSLLQVENLIAEYLEDEDVIFVEWKPPKGKLSHCATNYFVEISSMKMNRNISTINTNEKIYFLYSCMTYTIRVHTVNGQTHHPARAAIELKVTVPEKGEKIHIN